MQQNQQLEDYFKGSFIPNIVAVKHKLRNIKAFIFDWDGVFNNGQKNIEGHSTFSEVDAMGINLLRFGYYLINKKLPITAVITGENNQLAFAYAKRENFDVVYSRALNKEKALVHLCQQYNLTPSEVMFVFDDVLDFSVAKLAGLRMMIGRSANPMLLDFAEKNRLVDYITFNDGANNALREICEMILLMTNNYNQVIDHRMKFSETYQTYLDLRRSNETLSFFLQQQEIVQSLLP